MRVPPMAQHARVASRRANIPEEEVKRNDRKREAEEESAACGCESRDDLHLG